jgi:hypothetical protein
MGLPSAFSDNNSAENFSESNRAKRGFTTADGAFNDNVGKLVKYAHAVLMPL